MLKVRIRAFQAIRDATIEAKGFTAITGRSNLGKSAAVRAIRGAIFGIPGDHYVREGEAASRVDLEVNGHTLIWQKVRKKRPGLQTFLSVDGATHTRIGRSGHPDLTAPAGFREVKAGDAVLRPQVAGQHDRIFLLEETRGTAAEVFKLLGRVDVVTTAQANAKRDYRGTIEERGLRTADREAAEGALTELAWVEERAAEYAAMVPEVEAGLGRVAELQEQQIHVAQVASLAPVAVPVAPELPEPPLSLVGRIGRAMELSPSAVPPALGLPAPPVEPLRKVARILELSPAAVPESPRLPAGVQQKAGLLATIGRLVQARDAVNEAGSAVAAADLEIGRAEKERAALEAELGACPTCERAFS